MTMKLSDDEKYELEKRRLIESVSEAVEGALRKRYTWLAIIVSFLIGGGVTATVINITSGVQKNLIETDIMLKKAKESIKEVDNLSANVQEKYNIVDKDLNDLFERKNVFIDMLKDTNNQLEDTNKKLEELTTVVNSLIDKDASNKDIRKVKLSDSEAQYNLQKKLELSRYTLYLHYFNPQSKPEIKKKMEDLETYLKKLGYVIPRTQEVKDKARDIRYFHGNDEHAATILQEHIKGFFSETNSHEIMQLPTKNLSASYPDVRTGLIEVWLYL